MRRLDAAGIEAIATREPGGSEGAEILRNILLSGIVKPLGPAAEAILFAAARIDHIDNTIAPALRREHGSSPTASPIRRAPIRGARSIRASSMRWSASPWTACARI